jgi:hypothetical protein
MDWQSSYLFKLRNKSHYLARNRTDLPSRRSAAIMGREVQLKSYDTLLFYIDCTANVPVALIKAVVMETGRFLHSSGLRASYAYACLHGVGGVFLCSAKEPMTTNNTRPFLPVVEYVCQFVETPLVSAEEAQPPELLKKFFRNNALIVVIGKKENLPTDEYFKTFKEHVHIFNITGSEIDGYYLQFGSFMETVKQKTEDQPCE